jgi:hypothetical protein
MNIRMIATSMVVASAMATTMVAPSATAATSHGRQSSQPADSKASATQRVGIDVAWVKHSFVGEGADFLRVVVKQNNLRAGDGLRIYIDARGKNPGPEFVVEGYTGSEWTLRRAETWKKFGAEVACPSSSFAMNESKDRSTLRLLWSCLSNHAHFRLAVRANSTNGPNIDWWPSFHEFGKWFSI